MSTINLDNKTILVTGAAGFIGSNLVKRIYQEAPSATVVGIDNMNDYYDVALKEFRLKELAKYPTFTFVKGNIADKDLHFLLLRNSIRCSSICRIANHTHLSFLLQKNI